MDLTARLDDYIGQYIVSAGYMDTFEKEAIDAACDFLENEGIVFEYESSTIGDERRGFASFAWIEEGRPVLFSFLYEV